jgi:glycosyltransferase involved in cell wall biosynthesis
MTPRISVLLPVRDARATLDGCLDSLAAQTLADHEVVAVDDGSADGSGQRLLERAERDSRLRVLRSEPRGIAAALNHALAEARAPLVARMDADDLSHPSRLALQAERLEHDASVDVLASRVALGAEAGEGMQAYVAWVNGLVDHEAMARDRFVESPVVHPSVAMRAATLRVLGGYRDFDGPEDYELWLRAFDARLRFAKLAEALVEWRDSPGRLTRSDPRYAPERFRAVKLEALERGPLAAHARPLVVWGAGRIGKAWSRMLRARGRGPVAFVEVDPRKLGQRIHGVPVVPVEQAARWPEALHLAAVGRPGAREQIRAAARQLGLSDGCDLVAVA